MTLDDLKDLRRQLDQAISLIEQDQMRDTGFHSNQTYVGDFKITRVRGFEVKGYRATSIQFDEWNQP